MILKTVAEPVLSTVEGPVEEPALSLPKGQCSPNSEADGPAHRGTYDIHRRLAETRFDPDHPVHKFVEAYEEVAETFRRQDEDNDNDENVRKWIAGEARDSYGMYIWQYAPANPAVERLLRPESRRRPPCQNPRASGAPQWSPTGCAKRGPTRPREP